MRSSKNRPGERERSRGGILVVIAILFSLALPAPEARAHRTEVFAFGGYQFGGGLDTEAGRLDIKNAAAGGVTVGIKVRPDALVEVFYSYQGAGLRLGDRFPAPDSTLFDLGVHYVQLGGTIQQDYGRLSPFFGMTLGLAVFDPKPAEYSAEVRFAGSLSGGVKAHLSSRIGVRGQVRVWASLFSTGSSIFCRLPGACAISVTGNALVQGETSAGLFVMF